MIQSPRNPDRAIKDPKLESPGGRVDPIADARRHVAREFSREPRDISQASVPQWVIIRSNAPLRLKARLTTKLDGTGTWLSDEAQFTGRIKEEGAASILLSSALSGSL